MEGLSLNIEELKDFLQHIINNNKEIQKEGKIPVAVEIEGESGIGKTSAALQLADELGLSCVKLNLSQIEELGDLVGYPNKEFQVCKEDFDGNTKEEDCKWVSENVIDNYLNNGYLFMDRTRMSYAPPEWIEGASSDGGILILDDYSRAQQMFIQATMELIDRQQYISWKLPDNWMILLTSNPDDGNYAVTTLDDAQSTRFISINMKFDKDCWARWAEKEGIDGRCINFLLLYPELITKKINARSVTTFFNSITSIKDFSSQISMIQKIGEGSVGTVFATKFNLFINNRLDKLITADKMLNGKKEEVLNSVKGILGADDKYRADIASVLATRLVNFCLNMSDKGSIPDPIIVRLSILVSEDGVFSKDLKFYIAREFKLRAPNKFQKLFLNNKISKLAIA